MAIGAAITRLTRLTFSCYAVIPWSVVAGPDGEEKKNTKRTATAGSIPTTAVAGRPSGKQRRHHISCGENG